MDCLAETLHPVEDACMKRPADLLSQSDGSETVEWAIILGVLALGAIALITFIGDWAMDVFRTLADHAASEG